MTHFALRDPVDQYERLRAENLEEEQRRTCEYLQQQHLRESAALEQQAAHERRQFEHQLSFFSHRLSSLAEPRRTAAPMPQPTAKEKDRLNRLYWYNLMFR